MKLQSQVSRKVGSTEYIKSWVVLPRALLKKLGWKTGELLDAEVQGNKLVMKKA